MAQSLVPVKGVIIDFNHLYDILYLTMDREKERMGNTYKYRKKIYALIAVLTMEITFTIFSAFSFIDEYRGTWHDTTSAVEGDFSDATVTDTTEAHQSSDGSQVVEDTSHAVDREGNMLDGHMIETTHPDGSVTSHQEVSNTSKYGVKRSEDTTWEYDKDGNLVKETSHEGTQRVDPSEGLETDEVRGAGTQYETPMDTLYDSGYVKTDFPNSNTSVIQDVANEKSYTLDNNTQTYTELELYYCLDFMDTLRAQGNPYVPKDEDLTYEATGKTRVIAGHFAKQIIVKNKGKIYEERWVAADISAVPIVTRKPAPKKAQEYVLGITSSDPSTKRMLSRLVLEKTTFMYNQKYKTITKRIRRRQVNKNEFSIPQDFSQKPPPSNQ